MAVDQFLKLKGIEGEAQDSKHGKEIDVLAWSWGVSNSGTSHVGGGSGAGKANFQDISVTKYIDKASPVLLQHCAQGTHIDEATLVVRKAGGEALEYLTINMKQVMVGSVSTGGSGGEDRLTENLTLNFGWVEVKYQPQNAKGGKEGGEIRFAYDIAKNVKA